MTADHEARTAIAAAEAILATSPAYVPPRRGTAHVMLGDLATGRLASASFDWELRDDGALVLTPPPDQARRVLDTTAGSDESAPAFWQRLVSDLDWRGP